MDGIKRAQSNGITIAYETFGQESATPVLLVMGLGTQMLGWDADFCEMLAGQGHYVIRFDTGISACPPTLTTPRSANRLPPSSAANLPTWYPIWPRMLGVWSASPPEIVTMPSR